MSKEQTLREEIQHKAKYHAKEFESDYDGYPEYTEKFVHTRVLEAYIAGATEYASHPPSGKVNLESDKSTLEPGSKLDNPAVRNFRCTDNEDPIIALAKSCLFLGRRGYSNITSDEDCWKDFIYRPENMQLLTNAYASQKAAGREWIEEYKKQLLEKAHLLVEFNKIPSTILVEYGVLIPSTK